MIVEKYTKKQVSKIWEIINSDKYKLIEGIELASKKTNIKKCTIQAAYYNKKSWLYNQGKVYTNSIILGKDVKICMTLIKEHADNIKHASRLAEKITGISAAQIYQSYCSSGGVLHSYRKNNTLFNILGFFNIFKKNMKNNIAKGKTSL